MLGKESFAFICVQVHQTRLHLIVFAVGKGFVIWNQVGRIANAGPNY